MSIETDIDKRIDELFSLEEGWLDGDGLPIDRSILEHARVLVKYLCTGEGSVIRPGIFPTPEGKIQIEWLGNDRCIDFKIDGNEYEVDCFRGSTNNMTTEIFNNDEELKKELHRLLTT